jgi:hypothetical protein
MTSNKDEKEKLSVKQLKAINLILVGENLSSVARQLKVHRVTVSRWVNDDSDFKQRLKKEKKLIQANIHSGLLQLYSLSIKLLMRELDETKDIKVAETVFKTLVSSKFIDFSDSNSTEPELEYVKVLDLRSGINPVSDS